MANAGNLLLNIAFGALCCVVLKQNTTIYHAIIITINNSLKCCYLTTYALSVSPVDPPEELNYLSILSTTFKISPYLYVGYAFHRYVIVCNPEYLKKLNNLWCALLYVVVLVLFQYGCDEFILTSQKNLSTYELAIFLEIAVRNVFAIAASVCHFVVAHRMKKRYNTSVDLLLRACFW